MMLVMGAAFVHERAACVFAVENYENRNVLIWKEWSVNF